MGISSDELSFDEGTDSSSEEEFLEYLEAMHKLPKAPKQKHFFERKHPFDEFDNDEFVKRFRFSKNIVKQIETLLTPKLKYSDRRNNPVPILDQILLTLRYYAVGSFQIVGGDLIGVHQTTIGRIVKRVTIALASFSKEYIRMPQTSEEYGNIKNGFYSKFDFPNVIGVIDGTHIPILNPGGNDGERFRNRKGEFSINTQVVCDSDMRIIDIVCRWPGSTHDQTVLNFSQLRAILEAGDGLNGYLLGDAGYACKSYLITPLDNPVTTGQKNYNKSFTLARITIERLFGIWKNRFPTLRTKMRVDVEFAVISVIATAVLHNFAINKNAQLPEPEIDNIQQNVDIEYTNDSRGANFSVRTAVINRFFSTE